MTTYTWNIANLERHTAGDIVHTIHWTLSATDGVNTVGSYGSVGKAAPADGDPVVPYASLIPEIVIGWAKDELDVDAMEAALQAQLDELAAPVSESGLPW